MCAAKYTIPVSARETELLIYFQGLAAYLRDSAKQDATLFAAPILTPTHCLHISITFLLLQLSAAILEDMKSARR
jgi:hypothetical protein